MVARGSPVRLVGNADGATTGLSRYARSLAEALAELGVAVRVERAAGPPLPRPLVAGARRVGWDLDAFFRTYPTHVPSAPSGTITHLTAQGLASALAWPPRRSPRADVVVTVHDLLTYGRRHDRQLTGYLTPYDRLFDTLSARGLRRAGTLIAVSEHTRAEIEHLLGTPPARIRVIYSGVDHRRFRPDPIDPGLYQRYALRIDVPYVLYVGSEDPRKNLRALLCAFRALLDRVPNAVLLKVGAARFARERQALVAEVRRLGLQERVRLLDQVPDGDLVGLFRLANAFVFPSLYEGFGLPVLEAMACGTPVIASNLTALPEAAGDAALLVAPTDIGALTEAMERVLTDPRLATDLRERGLKRAAGFTWERTARQTMDVYGALALGRP